MKKVAGYLRDYNAVNLVIVDIKNEAYDDRNSCFVGTGISGYQIAKRLSKERFHLDNCAMSKTVLNGSNEFGDSSKLIDQISSHLHNNALLIISGSVNDPIFHSLRNAAIVSAPCLLWSLLESEDNALEFPALIQPQKNESITIMPSDADYIMKAVVLVQTLNHYLHEQGFMAVEISDIIDLFGGRWTDIMNMETDDQSYMDDIQRFITHNHLKQAELAVLIIFAGPSITLNIFNNIVQLFFNSLPHDSNMRCNGYWENAFDANIHIAFIVDHSFARPRGHTMANSTICVMKATSFHDK